MIIVPVVPKMGCIEDNCHTNVARHILIYGGSPVLCMYLDSVNNRINLIKHTVWKSDEGTLYDITPMYDDRSYNTIAMADNVPYRAISIKSDLTVEFF